jgi:hypothetical protein
MAAILPFLKDDPVFDPEATHAMSVAFDEACAALGVAETSARERELIATRIIDLAWGGERDADLLRDRVLREAGRSNAEPPEAARKWRGVA